MLTEEKRNHYFEWIAKYHFHSVKAFSPGHYKFLPKNLVDHFRISYDEANEVQAAWKAANPVQFYWIENYNELITYTSKYIQAINESEKEYTDETVLMLWDYVSKAPDFKTRCKRYFCLVYTSDLYYKKLDLEKVMVIMEKLLKGE